MRASSDSVEMLEGGGGVTTTSTELATGVVAARTSNVDDLCGLNDRGGSFERMLLSASGDGGIAGGRDSIGGGGETPLDRASNSPSRGPGRARCDFFSLMLT